MEKKSIVIKVMKKRLAPYGLRYAAYEGYRRFSREGEKEYFWYYEILISDKPSSEFDIEVENRENAVVSVTKAEEVSREELLA